MGRSSAVAARVTAELVIAAIALALVGGALAATQSWLDHHFLPSFLFPRDWYVRAETAARVFMAIAGLWLILSTRPRVGRLVARAPGMSLSIVIAVLLAFGASEGALRGMRLRPTEWLVPDEEPRRQPDARLGWTLVPGRTGQNSIAGRVIDYAIDPNGYRVARVDAPVDHAKPTIVFIGESVVFGEGLTWEESIPAQVASLTGMQTANLAVHGFGNDQAFMRLQNDLPRFQEPIAVVSLFMPALFGRNLDHDRPHLGPGLIWQASESRSRLASLASMLVPYRSDDTIEHGVESTREVLRGTIALAQSRGAQAIVVVPQFGPDSEPERLLRQRVLDEGQVPYVLVPIAADWRLAWDRHPDARAARAMAVAISNNLRQSRPQSR